MKRLAIAILAMAISQVSAGQSCQKDRNKPEVPSNRYEIAHTNSSDTDTFRRLIPALATTRDGRVGIAKVADNSQSGQRGFNFFLLKPEIEQGYLHRPSLQKPLAMVDYNNLPGVVRTIPFSAIQNAATRDGFAAPKDLQHLTLCDHRSFRPLNLVNQGGVDEYVFRVVAFEPEVNASKDVAAWTFEVVARVNNPKTPSASFSNVYIKSTMGKKVMPGLRVGLEPNITADGQLMVVRTPLKYSYNPIPCDPNGWTDPQPLTKGYSDPNLRNADGSAKYGLFRYPLRDSQGNKITQLTPGYPWMDSKGNNLFYTALNRTVGRWGDVKVPFSCADGGSGCNIVEDGGEFRGYSVIGLWTHGKATLLDGMLSNVDYPASSIKSQQKVLNLYRNDSTGVRITGNRFNSAMRFKQYVGAAFSNFSISESLENKLNYNYALHPTTPRDVVWKMTRGAYTDEVVFDEYMDPNYLIYSEMVGAITNGTAVYHDGFAEGSAGCYYGDVRIQNAASSLQYKSQVPAYGFLKNTTQGRIEPVALGGIKGKGLYVGPGNGLVYNMATNKDLQNSTAFFSAFYDLRSAATGKWHNLLQTPTGNRVQVKLEADGTLYQFRVQKGSTYDYYTFASRAKEGQWFHLALIENATKIHMTLDGNERISHIKNGFDLGLLGLATQTSQLEVGSVGGGGAIGFSGWLDDVRLIANADVYLWNPEMSCNMARGSLLKRISGTGFTAKINRYNLSGHTDFFCHTNYVFNSYKPDDVFKGLDPSKYLSKRTQFTMRGSEIVGDEPRPDFTGNNFCLTCHVDTSKDPLRPASLKVEALDAGTVNAMFDHRRQPLQPPNLWNGFLPKNYFKGFNNNTLGPAMNYDDCGKQGDHCNVDPLMFD